MRVEDYHRIRRDSIANTWFITTPDDTQYLYEPVAAWQSYDNTNLNETKLATQHRWLLSSVTDTHGNKVDYSYCDGVQHCYPDQVTYNGTTIKFYREWRPVRIARTLPRLENPLKSTCTSMIHLKTIHWSEELPKHMRRTVLRHSRH